MTDLNVDLYLQISRYLSKYCNPFRTIILIDIQTRTRDHGSHAFVKCHPTQENSSTMSLRVTDQGKGVGWLVSCIWTPRLIWSVTGIHWESNLHLCFIPTQILFDPPPSSVLFVLTQCSVCFCYSLLPTFKTNRAREDVGIWYAAYPCTYSWSRVMPLKRVQRCVPFKQQKKIAMESTTRDPRSWRRINRCISFNIGKDRS